LIVLAIAGIVDVVPGGGTGANVAGQVVSLGFLAAAAWIGSRLYREHRVALYALGDRRRAILYVAVGAAIVLISASSRLMATGPGTVAWIVVLALCVYAVFAVVWSARQY
jgi:hypothetical protein